MSTKFSFQTAVTIDGWTRTILEWSLASHVKPITICARIQRGWSAREAIFKPIDVSVIGRKKRTKHGLAKTAEYKIWNGIVARCHNQNLACFSRYGGRGITICDEWRNDFSAFLRDMGPRPSKFHSIDRRNNSQGYCKDNCYWATATEQSRNTRRNRRITAFGETKTMAEWSHQFGIPQSTLRRRLTNGWRADDAISTPVRSHKSYDYQ